MKRVIIIMGSNVDLAHCEKISTAVQSFGVHCEMRCASAHKVPHKVLELLKNYDTGTTVFITVAGRSNALSGFADAQTVSPVIACPPYSEAFSGADLYSTLRMPSGVAPLTVLDPENAALAAVKILAIADPALRTKIEEYHKRKKDEIEKADAEIKNQTEH
jgi:5-(carboxyamino)imidazole ribonucleotide mutase